jgi:hypothetical protein
VYCVLAQSSRMKSASCSLCRDSSMGRLASAGAEDGKIGEGAVLACICMSAQVVCEKRSEIPIATSSRAWGVDAASWQTSFSSIIRYQMESRKPRVSVPGGARATSTEFHCLTILEERNSVRINTVPLYENLLEVSRPCRTLNAASKIIVTHSR